MKILPSKKDIVRTLLIFCIDSIINAPVLGIMALATVVIRSITALILILRKKPHPYVPLFGLMVLLMLEIRLVLDWKTIQSNVESNGRDIAYAINIHKQKTGSYPDSLQEIRPYMWNKTSRSKIFLFLGPSHFGYQKIPSASTTTITGKSSEKFLLTYYETFWQQKFWDTQSSQWKDLK